MSKSRFWVKTLVPLSVAGLLLTGCSGGAAPAAPSQPVVVSDTLRVNWGSFPQTWEPGSQQMEPGTMRIPYETLVLREKDGTILPNLATEWKFGEGSKSLTLTLREGVTFHDGTPFDAAAVVANVEYVRDVVGGQFGGPLKASVASVVADDANTVTFTFTRPYGTFLALLSQRNLPMASPTAIADGSIKTKPVGTGPWAYDTAKSTAGSMMYFGEFANYWGEKPGFKNVELFAIADDTAASAALLAGDLDVTDTETDELPRLEGASNIATFDYPAIRNNINFIDRADGGTFGDQKVRQALCLAMDAEVVAKLGGGDTQTQHFIEGEPGYNPDIKGFQGNLDEALKIWKELGNPAITAQIGAAPFNKQEIQIRVDQMNKLPNVKITMQELDMAQYLSTWNSGQYPIALGNNPQITPADWYGAWFSDTAPGNPSKFVSPELKGLAGQAQAAGGSPEANTKWAAVMKQISDEALVCSHFASNEIIAYNTDKVANVEPAVQVWEQNLINYRTIRPAGA